MSVIHVILTNNTLTFFNFFLSVDSKAVDPSLSHAKVTLDKLEIRIKYQRKAAVLSRSSDGRPQKKGIESFFTK